MKHKIFYPHVKKIMKPAKIEALPKEIYLPAPAKMRTKSLEILWGQ